MKTKLTVIFFLFVFGVPVGVGAEQAQSNNVSGQASTVAASQVATYDQLVAAIRKARAESQSRVERAVAQEKVRECWETGKLIDEHVLQHKERADYGEKVLERLAADLGTSHTELKYMLQFARTYPTGRPADQLSWSHHEALLSLNDIKEQTEVAELASKENWTRDQIREEVKKRKEAKNEAPMPAAAEEKFTARLGKSGTYKIVKVKGGAEAGKFMIDLGFSNYYRTSRPLGFKEGTIIEALVVLPDGNSSPSDKVKLSKRTADDLYTYRAAVTEVLDGDTVNAVVDLGFGVRSMQTLRLRGIDAPELVSREGKEAKAELEKMLGIAYSVERGGESLENSATRKAQRTTSHEEAGGRGTEANVLIRTVKSDKYDRYLADIFVDGVCVNQELVERGFATRVRDS